MELSPSTTSIIALAGLAFALLALLLAAGQGRRMRAMRRAAGARARLPLSSVDTAEDLAVLHDAVLHSIQHVGLVRFDAFEDMGGKLSFAAALLDAEGTGIVMCSINGRNETRIYAKPVERGMSQITLSDEESEAIRRALGGVRV